MKIISLIVSLLGTYLMNLAWLMLDSKDRENYIEKISSMVQKRKAH